MELFQASSSSSETGISLLRQHHGKAGVRTDNPPSDLVSVVIPCYNHGQYLPEAVESVLKQNHPHIEVIVIDDGSTDNTREVVQQRYAHNEAVKYFYQPNQGLSAARNTGIEHSLGDYIVFLDADDWLADDALTINLAYLGRDPELAFVSGGHVKINKHTTYREEAHTVVEHDHYHAMLRGNYIGMHATVMYRKWVFNEFKFDTTLKVSEDYDMYLHVARKYPVAHHTHTIAWYRFHDSNMSGDLCRMLQTTQQVLKRQKPFLANESEKQQLEEGLRIWQDYYGALLLRSLPQKRMWPLTPKMIREHFIAFRYHPRPYGSYMKSRTLMLIQKLKRGLKKLFSHNTYNNNSPRPGNISLGDFNRTKPFSTRYGYDRGGPIDRYYIENYLTSASGLIQGKVLEIGDNEYTLRFGGAKVTASDILHVSDNNPQATYVGDLSDAPQVPSDTFDCIVLTQTLHLIYNCKEALATCYRILKPGGALLLTVPGISHIDMEDWGEYWMWSFTSNSLQRMLSEVFDPSNIQIQTFGNVLVASAFLYGMGKRELTQSQLDTHDPHYQVIITATAKK